MFLNVARERLDIVVKHRIVQFRRGAFDHDMLMNFHIAIEVSWLASAGTRNGPCTDEIVRAYRSSRRVPQPPSEKIHLKLNVVAVNARILDCILVLVDQLWSQRLISINQQYPFAS